MQGRHIDFPVDGGTCGGYLAAPVEGQGPAVIVLQEWWGLTPHIEDVCDRFAREGFVALAPDLYHGERASGPDDAGRLMMALEIARASRDLRAAAQRVTRDPASATAKAGVIGFCMGGQLALFAACESAEIGACVDFYGIHPKVRPDLAALARNGTPVLGIFAEKDAFVTPADGRDLAARVRAVGGRFELHVYPNVDHAFFNDTRPEVHDSAAAQDAWQRTLRFLRDNTSRRTG
ncbi:MAG: dienelactone hydrolase family protein [Myxococcota bacterium]